MTFVARGGLWVVAQLALFAVAGGFLAAGRGFDAGPLVTLAGWLLAAAGAVLALAGAAALGGNLTPFPAPARAGSLVTGGVYRWARHPIYGGVFLVVTGVGMLAGNGGTLGVGLLLLPFFVLKARHEESRLVAAFEDYRAYRAAVRRILIPWIV